MQPSDGSRFRDLLRGMGRMYAQEPDVLVLDAYWVALRDWPLDEFESACRQLMKTAKFMPRPADFTELRNAERMTAGEAWALVLEYVRDGYGFMSGPRPPEDPLITAAVNAVGGYQAIAMSERGNTPFLERRFAEHYEAIGQREDVRASVPQIAGPSRTRVSGPRSLAEIGFEVDAP